MSETIKRILMAVIFIPICLFFVFSNVFYGIGFLVIILGVSFLGTLEFLDICSVKQVPTSKYLIIFFNLSLIILSFLSTFNYFNINTIYLIILYFFILFCIEIFKNKDFSLSLESIGMQMTIIIYLGLLLIFPVLIKMLPNGSYLLFWVLCIVWMADSGAYFGGRMLGKHKAGLKASPNKSIEGYIAGILSGMLISIALALVFSDYYKSSIIGMGLLGLIFSIIGFIGDLVESVIKRSSKVKDSKTWIPGHGGVLDVFDAFIFSAPCAYFVQQYIYPII